MGKITIRTMAGRLQFVDVGELAEEKLSVQSSPATEISLGDVEGSIDSICNYLALVISKLHDKGILSDSEVAEMFGEELY